MTEVHIHSAGAERDAAQAANDAPNGNHNEPIVGTLVNRRTFYDNEPKTAVRHTPEVPPRSIRLAPIVDHQRTTLTIARAVSRKMSEDGVVRIGRMEHAEDKVRAIVFTEKVVSRQHAELVLMDGLWHVRDIGSSSGTFINSERLSPASQPSTLRQLRTGDVLRFGVDYRGGHEAQFRAVTVRVELNGERNVELTGFQTEQVNGLKTISAGMTTAHFGEPAVAEACALCLGNMDAHKALFMAPCGHMWHYKCIRICLVEKYPFFNCPLCRKTFDVEMASDDEADDEDDDDGMTSSV